MSIDQAGPISGVVVFRDDYFHRVHVIRRSSIMTVGWTAEKVTVWFDTEHCLEITIRGNYADEVRQRDEIVSALVDEDVDVIFRRENKHDANWMRTPDRERVSR